jgi:hypothetical protein
MVKEFMDWKSKGKGETEKLMARIVGEVEQLTPGQSLIYKLPEYYWSFAAFLICDINPEFPKKGKKYVLSTDSAVDGKPAGQKKRISEEKKAEEFADWVAQREGQRFN